MGDDQMYAMTTKSASALSHTSAEPPRRKVYIRYGLMGLHFVFILTILVQSYVQGNNALCLLVHAIGLAAFLIYVPAAVVLCHKRKACSFGNVAGETSYTAVQGVIWALSAATSFLAIVQSSCTALLPAPPSSSIDPNNPLVDPSSASEAEASQRMGEAATEWLCGKYLVTAILSLVHVALLLGMTVWVVLEVRRGAKGRGFKVPVGELLRGGGA